MFDRKNVSSEIANSMHRVLVGETVNKQVEPLDKIAKAMEYLNSAAEIFDDVGLIKQAEATTFLLESLAKKKKTKSKIKKKKTDPATKDLTSEKMVSNLEHKGWVFNTDDGDDNFANDDINDLKLGLTGGFHSFKKEENPDFWRFQARKLINNNKFDEAEECLKKAKHLDSLSEYDNHYKYEELNVDDNYAHEEYDFEDEVEIPEDRPTEPVLSLVTRKHHKQDPLENIFQEWANKHRRDRNSSW